MCFPWLSHVFPAFSPRFPHVFPTFSPRFLHVFPVAPGPGLASAASAAQGARHVMTFDQHAAEQLAMEAAEAMQEVPPEAAVEPNGDLLWFYDGLMVLL